MAMTNNERQAAWRNRQKLRQTMELELGEDLDDTTPIPQGNLTPLEYMLKVMNDPNAEKDRRDRMAQAAAPYLHPKADQTAGPKTKKEEQAEAADQASSGMFAPAAPPKMTVN